MNDETIREAFEAFIIAEMDPMGALKNKRGQYIEEEARCAWLGWKAACKWISTRAQASAPEGEEAVAGLWIGNASGEGTVGYGFSNRPALSKLPAGNYLLYTRSNAKAGEVDWQEMDSAPEDKAIMGAWFGAPEYTEVSPVIYCSERGKWMNPDDMRDDEFTKPDMWQPYPSPPKHRDLFTHDKTKA